MSQLHTCHFEHNSTRFASVSIVIVVIQIHNFADTRLDDDLCTFIAWEQGNVKRRTVDTRTAFVQYGVHLRMHNFGSWPGELATTRFAVSTHQCSNQLTIWILVVKDTRCLSCPGQNCVVATTRKTIVADADDAFVCIHNTRSDLCVGIFRSLGA